MKNDVLEKIKLEMAAFNEKRKALVEELRKEFPAILAPLFEKSKKIHSIGWRQYTPYFNDGESCEFGVHNSDLTVNGFREWEDDDEDGDSTMFLSKTINLPITADNLEEHIEFNTNGGGSSWYLKRGIGEEGNFPNPDYNGSEAQVVDEFADILRSIPDDFYEELFGDHVEVTVHRDGRIEVEDYEHD